MALAKTSEASARVDIVWTLPPAASITRGGAMTAKVKPGCALRAFQAWSHPSGRQRSHYGEGREGGAWMLEQVVDPLGDLQFDHGSEYQSLTPRVSR